MPIYWNFSSFLYTCFKIMPIIFSWILLPTILNISALRVSPWWTKIILIRIVWIHVNIIRMLLIYVYCTSSLALIDKHVLAIVKILLWMLSFFIVMIMNSITKIICVIAIGLIIAIYVWIDWYIRLAFHFYYYNLKKNT